MMIPDPRTATLAELLRACDELPRADLQTLCQRNDPNGSWTDAAYCAEFGEGMQPTDELRENAREMFRNS